jgi:hypothetical protein
LTGPRALRRIGCRWVAVFGFLAIAAGALMLPLGGFVVAFAFVGAGLGAASVASTKAGTEAAVPEHRGVASGVLTASAQIGTALGMAALMPLATSASPDGYRAGYLGAAVIALVGVVAALLLPTVTRRPAVAVHTGGCAMNE